MANSDYTIKGNGTFATMAMLSKSIGLHDDSITIKSFRQARPTVPQPGEGLMIGNEIMKVVSFNKNKVFVSRGAVDTIPQTHLANEIVWFYENSVGSDKLVYLDNEEIGVKPLPKTASKPPLAIAVSPPRGLTMGKRFGRPYPPGDVRVNDTPFEATYAWFPGVSKKYKITGGPDGFETGWHTDPYDAMEEMKAALSAEDGFTWSVDAPSSPSFDAGDFSTVRYRRTEFLDIEEWRATYEYVARGGAYDLSDKPWFDSKLGAFAWAIEDTNERFGSTCRGFNPSTGANASAGFVLSDPQTADLDNLTCTLNTTWATAYQGPATYPEFSCEVDPSPTSDPGWRPVMQNRIIHVPNVVQSEEYAIVSDDEDVSLILTWKHRNRLSQADVLVGHEEGTIALEPSATYTVEIVVDDVVVRSEDSITDEIFIYTESDWTTDGNPPVFTITLKTVRGAEVSWQHYEIVINGTADVLEFPIPTVMPEVTGDAYPGSTLSTDDGTWSGSTPMTFGYQWMVNGVNVIGATDNTYDVPDTANVGDEVLCVVTATNAIGSVYAPSNVIELEETPAVPVNTVLPVITGTYEPGETLTCSEGTWSGSGTIVYTYQWQADGVDIGGETADTYEVTFGVIGQFVRCVVTATNDVGDDSATAVGDTVTAWTPALLPALQLWLDAADGSTFTLGVADAVTEWRDKSGNSRDVGPFPWFRNITVNGLPAVTGGGPGGAVLPSNITLIHDYFYMFAVVKTPTTGGANVLVNTSNSTVYAMDFEPTNWRPSRSVGTGPIITDARAYDGNLHLFGMNGNAAGTTSLQYIDADVLGPDSLPGGTFEGVGNYGSGSDFTGVLCELVIGDEYLTSGDLADLMNYLKTKWGTP